MIQTLLCLLLLLSTEVRANWRQGRGSTGDDTYGFALVGNHNRTVIPFEFRSNLIIVSVRVNDSDTMRFIIDTGVSYTILTNVKRMTRTLGPVVRRIELSGVGKGKSVTASVSIKNTVRLKGLLASNHTLVVLNEDLMRLSESAGLCIDGILGYELFANLIVTIDFQTREITVIRPRTYRYRPRKGDRIPLAIEGRKAYTQALSVFNGTAFVPLRVLLDTGAGQALLLDQFQQTVPVPLPDKVMRVDLGWGINGLISGSLGRLSRVRLGHTELTDVLASFPDSSTYNLKMASLPARQGSIGCELLRRFRVTFNYPDQYIVLKPIKRLLREPFDHDMSGLDLRAQGLDFRDYVVDQVLDNSPADQAGLQPGDELLFVNNCPSRTLSLGTINRLLRAGAGKPITLQIRRQNQLYRIDFVLKRLI